MTDLPALAPTTFAEMMQFAELLAQSTMVPPAYQKNPANIVLAIIYGREIGLGVMQSLQNVAVIGGRPALWGDAMLALVKASPLCEDVIETLERNAAGDITGAVCDARRKGKEPVVVSFSVSDAKRATLWDKAGPWKQYPSRMLQMRARGFALRDAFPDILRGVIMAEEAADIPRQAKDVTPDQTVAADLDAFAPAAPGSNFQTVDIRPAPTQGEIDLGLEPDPRAQESDPIPDAPKGVETEDTASAAFGEVSLPLVTIEALKPARVGRGWDWPGYADAVLKTAAGLPKDHFGAFRVANAPMLNSLRMSNKTEWSRVQQGLADYEREGDER